MKNENKTTTEVLNEFNSVIKSYAASTCDNKLNAYSYGAKRIASRMEDAVKTVTDFQNGLTVNPAWAFRNFGERSLAASQTIDLVAKLWAVTDHLSKNTDFEAAFRGALQDRLEEWTEEMLTNTTPMGVSGDMAVARRSVLAGLIRDVKGILRDLSK
jgi:hypothetical protein